MTRRRRFLPLLTATFCLLTLVFSTSVAQAHDGAHGTLEVDAWLDLQDGGTQYDRRLPNVHVEISPGCDYSSSGDTLYNAPNTGILTFHACPINRYTTYSDYGVTVTTPAGYAIEDPHSKSVRLTLTAPDGRVSFLFRSATTASSYSAVPFKGYWNPWNVDHFYTIADFADGSYGYGYQGAQGYAFNGPAPGTVPMYRYWNAIGGDHFYTVSRNDGGYAYFGYSYEGIEGWVSPVSISGTTPLYRYFNGVGTDHFYTTSRNDAGYAYYGYGFESVEAYMFTAPQTVTVAPPAPSAPTPPPATGSINVRTFIDQRDGGSAFDRPLGGVQVTVAPACSSGSGTTSAASGAAGAEQLFNGCALGSHTVTATAPSGFTVSGSVSVGVTANTTTPASLSLLNQIDDPAYTGGWNTSSTDEGDLDAAYDGAFGALPIIAVSSSTKYDERTSHNALWTDSAGKQHWPIRYRYVRVFGPGDAPVYLRDSFGKPLVNKDGSLYVVNARQVKLQSTGAVESDPATGELLYYVWGDYRTGTGLEQRSGFIRASDLTSGRYPLPTSVVTTLGQNGMSYPGSTTPMVVVPTPLVGQFVGKRDTSTLRTIGTYGCASSKYNYAYVVWNLTDVPGGGMTRGIVPPGTTFYVSKLTKTTDLATRDAAGNPQTLTWKYGYYKVGTSARWGWIPAFDLRSTVPTSWPCA
jgi:hypothetical protein